MTSQSDATTSPIVLRYEGMHPSDLKGYEAHRTRKGGDLGHVDVERSHLNTRLIGSETWAADALKEIKQMKQHNFVAELESLDRRNRRKDFERRSLEGPHDPWRATRHGPMREVILTANKAWFDDYDEIDGKINFQGREQKFEKRAVAWLKAHFGEDLIHARADRDEAAYHIHAVIMPRAVVEIKGAKRYMLQPSIHPLIKDYEAAQDSVGAWFSGIGLRRGEKRKQAFREAVGAGKTPAEKRVHVKTVQWRRSEDIRLAAERRALKAEQRRVATREDAAEAVIAVAEGVADGLMTLDNSGSTPRLRTNRQAQAEQRAPILTRLRKSKVGRTRAADAFIAALIRMQARAKAKAEKQARAELARSFADIQAADEAIVGIARLLPSELRSRIAKARKTLTGKIMAIGRTVAADLEPKSGRSSKNSDDSDVKKL